jgi:hypothetical protein
MFWQRCRMALARGCSRTAVARQQVGRLGCLVPARTNHRFDLFFKRFLSCHVRFCRSSLVVLLSWLATAL